jgi:hypothetical protein
VALNAGGGNHLLEVIAAVVALQHGAVRTGTGSP